MLLNSCGAIQSSLSCKEQSLPMGNVEITSYGCDNNLDGDPDEAWITVEKKDGQTIECKLELDDGYTKRISCDYNGDGNPEFEFEGDQIYTEFEPVNGELAGKIYVFDSEGNYKEYTDNGLNGKIDTIEGFYINDQGKLIKYTSDNNANGIAEKIEESKYNKDGNLVKKILEIDSDEDGKIDEITSWYYDIQGNLIKCTSDKNANGIAEKTEESKYNKDGNLVKKILEIDSDEDGKIDMILAKYFGQQGNIIKKTHDGNANGIAEYIDEFEYNTNGDLVKKIYQTDLDEDGKYENIVVNEYGADGKLVKSTTDDKNGLCVFDYVNDDTLKSFTCDHDKDGKADFTSENTFDSDGNIVQQMSDYDGDGNPERVVEHKYDSEGNLIYSKTYCDYNSDGEVDKVWDEVNMCL